VYWRGRAYSESCSLAHRAYSEGSSSAYGVYSEGCLGVGLESLVGCL